MSDMPPIVIPDHLAATMDAARTAAETLGTVRAEGHTRAYGIRLHGYEIRGTLELIPGRVKTVSITWVHPTVCDCQGVDE